MAKGKKVSIKSINLISEDIIEVNGKEYVILESVKDITSAIAMKITSHGNRILRFEDEKKIAKIDVKRNIDVVKVTFTDAHRASRFKKFQDKSVISSSDKRELIEKTTSFIKAREIIDIYTNKSSKSYDKQNTISTFYFTREIK